MWGLFSYNTVHHVQLNKLFASMFGEKNVCSNVLQRHIPAQFFAGIKMWKTVTLLDWISNDGPLNMLCSDID